MTRHLTDPEQALDRASTVIMKMSWMKVPGLLSQAADWTEWLSKKGGSISLSTAGAGSGLISGATHVAAWAGGVGGAVGGALGAAAHFAGPAAIPLTVINAAYQAKAVYSTAWHVTALKALKSHASKSRMQLGMWRGDQSTLDALDYAIWQKTEKAVRRSASAVPGLGAIASAYTLGRAIFKKDKGKKRKNNADVLTNRMLDNGDFLATAIILELVGYEDFSYVVGLHQKNLKPKVGEAVAQKLRST